MHELTRQEARRVAVRAQLLTAEHPTDVVETVQGLSLLQLDPINAVAPSADLVLWSRLGSAYDPRDLRDAVDEQRLLELRNTLRPREDLALYRADMEAWPGAGELRDWQVFRRDWVETNQVCRLDILDRLRSDGPLRARDLPDTCVERWPSSGWNNNENVAMMLDLLVQRGEVAAAGRDGRHRLWDLAERVYPDEVVRPVAEARRRRYERRLSALGIARPRGPESVLDPLEEDTAGEEAVVEGLRGTWRVDPSRLGEDFDGRAALLSPFDRLLHDRKRMQELFEFDYVLEMYKPAEKRRWGYYALPVLYGDRLVGKLDAKADREAGELQVAALHRDVDFTPAMTDAIEREVEDLARWLGVVVFRES